MTDEMEEAREIIEELISFLEEIMPSRVMRADAFLASTEDTGGEFCEWWCDDEPFGDGYDMWESSCGVAYQFTSDGPKENHHNYCHKCGKPIRLSTEVTHEQRKP